jgi:hypothetical protein
VRAQTLLPHLKEKGKQKHKINSDAATISSQKKPTKDKEPVIKTKPDKEKKEYFFCEIEGHMKKIVPIITHGVQRNIIFLLFVKKLIQFQFQ